MTKREKIAFGVGCMLLASGVTGCDSGSDERKTDRDAVLPFDFTEVVKKSINTSAPNYYPVDSLSSDSVLLYMINKQPGIGNIVYRHSTIPIGLDLFMLVKQNYMASSGLSIVTLSDTSLNLHGYPIRKTLLELTNRADTLYEECFYFSYENFDLYSSCVTSTRQRFDQDRLPNARSFNAFIEITLDK